MNLYWDHFLAQVVHGPADSLGLRRGIDALVQMVVEVARGVRRHRTGGQRQLVQRAVRIRVIHHLLRPCVLRECHQFMLDANYLFYGLVSLLDFLRPRTFG